MALYRLIRSTFVDRIPPCRRQDTGSRLFGRNPCFSSSAPSTNVKAMTETRRPACIRQKRTLSSVPLLIYSCATSTKVKILTETRRLEVAQQEGTLAPVSRRFLQTSKHLRTPSTDVMRNTAPSPSIDVKALTETLETNIHASWLNIIHVRVVVLTNLL